MVGGPVNFSKMALRPLGPMVTLTASARALTPISSRARASELNRNSLAMAVSSFRGELCDWMSGDEDCSAADVAVVEIGDGRLEVVERVLLRVEVDRTAGGQRHQVAQ